MPSDVLITPATSKIDFTDASNSTKKLSISGTTFSFNSNLNVLSTTSLSSAFKAEGVNGTLFEVTDDLSNSLMSVNTIGGLPVFEVFANNSIIAGQYNANDFVISGNKIGLGYANPVNKLSISGSVSIGASYNVAAPSNGLIVQGNVGIATNNPGYTLEVNGTQRVVGNFYLFNTVVNPATNFSNQRGVGFEASTGKLEVAASASTALAIGRFGSTGQILDFRYEGTQIGNFSLDSTDLTLATSRHLILNPTGNVGIGIAIPTAPLEVQSNIGGTGIIIRGRADNSTALRFYANNGTTQQLYIGTDDTNIDFVSVSTRPIRFIVNDLLQYQISQLGVFSWKNGAGGDRMRLNSTGLGIGTTSPNTLLNVHGDNPFVRINNTITGDHGIKISYNNSDTHGLHLLYNANNALSFIDNTYPTSSGQVYGDIYFRQNVAGTMTTRMTIKADGGGNVGIGTTNPVGKLDVRAGSGGEIIFGSFDANYVVKIQSGDQLNFYNGASAGAGYINYGGGATVLSQNLHVEKATGATTGLVRINSNGSVGIGTTVPSGLLDVYNGAGRYLNYGTTGLLKVQRNVATSDGATPVLHLINTQGMESSTGLGTGIQMDLGYGGFTTNTVGTAARGTRISAVNDTLYTSTASTQNASLVFYTSTAGSLTEKLRIRSDGSLSPVSISSTTAGATLLRTDGTNGTLFSVVDDLSDSLMSVNNSAGLPVLEVFADDRIVAGQYGQNDFVVVNNKVGIGTNSPAYKLDVRGSTVNARVGVMEFGSWPSTATYVYLQNNTLPLIDGNYALLQGPTGETFVNAASGQTLHFRTNNTERWAILAAGILQSDGAQTIQTSTGPLTLATNGNNGHIVLSPNGTGNVGIGTTVPSASLHVRGASFRFEDSSADTNIRIGPMDNIYPYRRFDSYISDNSGYFWGFGQKTAAGATRVNAFFYDNSRGWYSADQLAVVTFTANEYNSSYTTFSEPIKLRASGATYFNGGNVGIGTTSPGYKLDVNGNSAFRDTVNFGPSVGLISWGSMGGGTGFGIRGESGRGFSLGANGSWDYLVINTSGNVGIGTTSPTSLLHLAGVGGDGVAFLRIAGTASDAFNWGSSVMYANLAATETAINLIGKAQSQYNSCYIGYRHVADGSASNMLSLGLYAADHLVNILGNGNVGIGTTNPGRKLHIYGTQSAIKLSNTGSGAWSGFEWSVGNGAYTAYSGLLDDTGRYFIDVGSNGDDFTILQNGNVGIDNITPVNKLAVSGSVSVGSNYNVAAPANGLIVEGSVGIGVSSLSAGVKLHVDGFFISKTLWSDVAAHSYWGNYSTAYGRLTWDTGLAWINATAGNVLYLGADGGNKHVTIATSGNVGIGTVTPTSKLHLNSTTSGAILLKADGTNGTLFSVSDDLSNSLMSVNTIGGLPVFEVFANNSIIAGQYGQNDFVISGNKVGIGKSNPAYKLDVNGTGNFSGTLIVNGISINQERANNARMYGADTGAFGLLGLDSAGSFRWQVYGESGNYGFLDSTWGNWDIKKAVNGQLDLRVSGVTVRVLNAGNYQDYALPLAGGTLTGALSGTTATFSGAIVQGSSQVLHAGNVATYALPIGGGTLTGALSGTSATFSGTISEGGYLAYPLREYVINLSSQSTASFYPVAIDNSPGTDATWHHQFSVDMVGQSGDAAYNMHSMYGEVRGQGWTDQAQFYRVFHNFYDNAERSILGIWRGTQTFYGVVVYLRGGKNYYVRTTSRSVVGYSAAQALGNAVFAIKNAAGADVSGTSANIGEMFNLINNPSGFYHSDNVYANLIGNVTGNVSGSSGTCTGLAASATTAAACTGNAVNVTGTVLVANGGTGVTTATANTFFAAPNGSTGAPSFRAMVSADIPANAVTFAKFQQMPTVSVLGVSGAATADVAAITGGGDQVLRMNAGATFLGFGAINLASSGAVTGILSVANGGTGSSTSGGGGSGTVTSVSVVSANGFDGSVNNNTTTPAITLTTTITGILKGNSTAISAATAGTDYLAPNTNITVDKITAAKAIIQKKEEQTNISGAVTIDVSTANVHVLTLNNGANVSSITYNNRAADPAVNTILLVIKYLGTSATIVWSNVIWANGNDPTLTKVNGYADVYALTSYKGASGYWIGTVVAQNLMSTNL